MTEIYLALGSNVGNGQTVFDDTIRLLAEEIQAIQQAPRYVSAAVGYTNQADFLNTVVRGTTVLSPGELLAFMKAIEARLGRIERFRWGPREIDIDIILYGQLIIQEPALIIPHPRFRERDFVMRPLLDLTPSLVDPVSGRPIAELYASLPAAERSIHHIA